MSHARGHCNLECGLPTESPFVVARTREAARVWVKAMKAEGRSVAFAPTMGALHDGHLSLIGLARAEADVAAASIFVNPTQFAANEDLATYPRQEARDIEMLRSAGCAFVYCPDPQEIYGPNDCTRIVMPVLSSMLEGAVRPHFFDGVASVVGRLFIHLTPDVAIFGEKDFQQLIVIQRMVSDLGMPIRIVGAPTVREDDGLAMSSRNAYLSKDERDRAPALQREMRIAAATIVAGGGIASALASAAKNILAAGFASVDYIELRDAASLSSIEDEAAPLGRDLRLLAAARLGRTRLIDNVPVVRLV